MLEELLKLTETLDYEENGGFYVAGAARKNSSDLELSIKFNDGVDDALQNWSLLCRREREHNIKLGSGTYIKVTNDHVLLWPYVKAHFSLWFTNSTKSASRKSPPTLLASCGKHIRRWWAKGFPSHVS